jgi:hypothetical protein
MRYRENNHGIAIDPIDYAVRETIDETSSDITLNPFRDFRKGDNEPNRLVKLIQEIVAKPYRLRFIPSKRLVKFELSQRKK